jgi:endoglucanase
MKKKIVFLMTFLLIVFLTATSCQTPQRAPAGEIVKTPICMESRIAQFSAGHPEGVAEAFRFVLSMKIGWNLGNSLDAHTDLNPNERAWGNPRATQELMDGVAEQGFGAVRIPVTWGNMIGPAPHYTINETWFSRVEEVVGYVLNAGMKAIINIHHDGADSYYWLSVRASDLTGPNKTAIDEKFTAVWRQIAERFRNIGEELIFEGFNELHDGTWGNGTTAQRNRVNELNQIFVNTVRAVGGANSNRYLLIHGWVTRPSVTVSSLVMPNDTVEHRLIVGIHFYDPYDFSGSATQNVWGNRAHMLGWANESHVRSTFNSVRDRFINNGIPVILGEYGAVHQGGNAFRFRKYYMEYVTKYAYDCGIISFYWDNGGFGEGSEKFGLLYREDGLPYDEFAEQVLAVMMRAVNYDYPLSSIPVP